MRTERKQRIDEVLDKRQPDLVIVMENVQDPHNIGAVMRTADSVGVQDVYTINTLIGIHEFRKKRSTGSADRWMNLHQYTSVQECVTALKSRGLKLWATHLGATAKSLYELELTEPVALIFGRERGGLSAELLQHCDGNFIIPQMGMIRSLNVSVACAVSLYEALRQRQQKGMYDGANKLPEARREALYADWTKRYTENSTGEPDLE
ncbi:MAG TPA: RNA methyltransferase [Chitinophagaceae bacterium]|nr:RNA methyltransferase [Chitinophagaceae bacterium]